MPDLPPPAVSSLVSDTRWAFVGPLVPDHGMAIPRSVLAAIIYIVINDVSWDALPDEFECPPATVKKRFQIWTESNLWGHITDMATGTPHYLWARTLRDAARHRADHLPRRQPQFSMPPELTPPRAGPARSRPSRAEYAEARAALDRHEGTEA